MSVRLIATDLDGTLLRTDQTVSARSRAALAEAEEAGLVVVLVTGRPPRWMAPVVEATGHRGIAICSNGGLIYDLHTEEVVRESPLQPEEAAAVVAALRDRLPGPTFAVERSTGFGCEPTYKTTWELPPDVLIADVEALIADPVVKLLVRHEGYDSDELLAAATDAAGDLATLTHSFGGGLVEISGVGVSKAFALEHLAGERGIEASEVVAFGDMPNDIPMLSWSGHGVAMAGAHPEVVAVADEVTASNDDDGVAVVVERILAGDHAGSSR